MIVKTEGIWYDDGKNRRMPKMWYSSGMTYERPGGNGRDR